MNFELLYSYMLSHLYIVFICWVDIQTGAATESFLTPSMDKSKDTSMFPEDKVVDVNKVVVNDQEEQVFSLADPLDAEKGSPEIWNNDSTVITPSYEKKGMVLPSINVFIRIQKFVEEIILIAWF